MERNIKATVTGRQTPGKAVSTFQATEGAVHEAGRNRAPRDDVLASLVSGDQRPHPGHEEVLACPTCPNCKRHKEIGTVEERGLTEAVRLRID